MLYLMPRLYYPVSGRWHTDYRDRSKTAELITPWWIDFTENPDGTVTINHVGINHSLDKVGPLCYPDMTRFGSERSLDVTHLCVHAIGTRPTDGRVVTNPMRINEYPKSHDHGTGNKTTIRVRCKLTLAPNLQSEVDEFRKTDRYKRMQQHRLARSQR